MATQRWGSPADGDVAYLDVVGEGSAVAWPLQRPAVPVVCHDLDLEMDAWSDF